MEGAIGVAAGVGFGSAVTLLYGGFLGAGAVALASIFKHRGQGHYGGYGGGYGGGGYGGGGYGGGGYGGGGYGGGGYGGGGYGGGGYGGGGYGGGGYGSGGYGGGGYGGGGHGGGWYGGGSYGKGSFGGGHSKANCQKGGGYAGSFVSHDKGSKGKGLSKGHGNSLHGATYGVADSYTSYAGDFGHPKAKSLTTSKGIHHKKRRRRRSAKKKSTGSKHGSNDSYYLTTEEKLLSEVHRQDLSRCGERLVCEVSSSARTRYLTDLEREILYFVRDGDRKFNAAYPGEAVTKNSPILKDYKKAAAFGNVGGACAERFRHCPFSAADIISRVMEIIRTRPAIRSNE